MPTLEPIRFAVPLVLACLAGCAVGPNYHRPSAPVPANFKEAAGWKPATPNDAADRGTWWEAFHDPVLNDLEQQAATANQSLLQAAANYEAARALARADRATLFPTLSVAASAQRAKGSSGRNGSANGSTTTNNSNTTTSTTGGTTSTTATSTSVSSGANDNFSASLGASWTPDFWGRVRRLSEADLAAAQASAADLANARLSTQAALAQNYVQLRIADARIRLREDAVAAYRRTLEIAQNKYNVGIVARNDVISAQAQLDAARAQVIDAGIQRAQLEHAIAVLVGKAPGEFTLASQPAVSLAAPAVPAQLPSELLERRPDLAAAERSVAQANARIGVQTAAYFPDLTLSANGGYQGSALDTLFRTPNRFWSLGANLADTLLDFGRRGDAVAQARALYDGTVAGYRAAVLRAFQEVEDNLASLRLLETEAQIEDSAVNEAAEAARIAMNEYRAGTADFTTVVTAQVAELNGRQTALTILQGRLVASIALTEALGGGWRATDLPAPKTVFGSK